MSLASRPVLFTLARALAEAWPADVPRDALVARAFRAKQADESYREEVLPRSCRARVACEAGSPFGWDRWIGEDGAFLGMETFGESGPYKDVYEHFGITAERLAELGRGVLDRIGART